MKWLKELGERILDWYDGFTYKFKDGKLTIRTKKPGERGFWFKITKRF